MSVAIDGSAKVTGDSSRPAHSRALLIVGLAALYFVAARLSLMLAVPPGYAAAIWPAAGIALAALLLYGPRLWPGVLIGSFAANLLSAHDASTGDGLIDVLLASASIGAGASLQALAGYWLVRRWVDIGGGLIDTGSTVRLLLLGGPLGCLVSASWGVGTLFLAGRVGGDELAFNWLTWWLGDSFGVLFVTPLAFIWLAAPRHLWKPRMLQVALPLMISVAIVMGVFLSESRRYTNEVKADYRRQAQFIGDILEKNIARNLEVVYSIQSLFNTAENVDRDEFRHFVERALARNPGLHALSWNPVVTRAQRDDFEASMRAQGFAGFRFTELGADGVPVTAAERDFYVIVHYIEPLQANSRALGFDVYSNLDRKRAMQSAHASGQLTATEPITLVQETGRQAGVLFFLPVYFEPPQSPPDAAAGELPNGFAVGVYRVGSMLEEGLRDVDATGFDIRLTDVGDARMPKVLASYRVAADGLAAGEFDETAAAALPAWQTTLDFGHRNWLLELRPSGDIATLRHSWTLWSMLVTGLVFSAILGSFLLILSGSKLREESRADLLARQVAEREAIEKELQLANERLEKIARTDELTQIYNRRAIEEIGARLAAESQRYRTPYSLLLLDIDHFKRVNDRWGHKTGDQVLQAFTDGIRDLLRDVDEFGRWGGEEFIVLASNTSLAEAAEFANRLCHAIAARHIEPVGNVTASIGVASSRDGESFDNLVLRADRALYRAKENGRNRVALEQEEP